MREHLINKIKEMLGPLGDIILNLDEVLNSRSDEELKLIIKRINFQNQQYFEEKRRKNERK
nr:MAG TPA: hypothetical protein [Caudoviricetes sp.]